MTFAPPSCSFRDFSFLFVAFAVLLNGCNGEGAGDDSEDRNGNSAGQGNSGTGNLPAFPRFAPEPEGQSVIGAGHEKEPAIVVDPSVYADAEGYHLFFTTLFCSAGQGQAPTWRAVTENACIDLPKGTTGYAYSSDRGMSWQLRETPVVFPRAGAWDSGDIESPFAFRWDDELVLIYAAFGQIVARFGMGAATLPLEARTIREALLDDGQSFVQRDEPVIPADFVQPGAVNNAQEPSIVTHEDSIDLYYVAIGLTRPDLGFVEGQLPTGIGLRRRRFDRGFVEVPDSDEALLGGINIAEVVESAGAVQLFSTSLEDSDDHRHEKVLWRQSTDGGADWSDAVVALDFGSSPIDDWGIMAPSVVLEDSRAVMFYTAWESSGGPCVESVRFGMADDAGERCLYGTVGRAEAARDTN
jgi:hypothetical protein